MKVHAIVGLVSVAFGDEVLGDANHVVHVLCATRVGIGSQDVQGIHVFVVGLDVSLDQSLPIAALFVGPVNDFVIDVGEILDVHDVVPAGFQPPVNEVKGEVAPSMPKMAAVVDRDATHVHRHLSGLESGERHLFSSPSVMDANGHGPR